MYSKDHKKYTNFTITFAASRQQSFHVVELNIGLQQIY